MQGREREVIYYLNTHTRRGYRKVKKSDDVVFYRAALLIPTDRSTFRNADNRRTITGKPDYRERPAANERNAIDRDASCNINISSRENTIDTFSREN